METERSGDAEWDAVLVKDFFSDWDSVPEFEIEPELRVRDCDGEKEIELEEDADVVGSMEQESVDEWEGDVVLRGDDDAVKAYVRELLGESDSVEDGVRVWVPDCDLTNVRLLEEEEVRSSDCVIVSLLVTLRVEVLDVVYVSVKVEQLRVKVLLENVVVRDSDGPNENDELADNETVGPWDGVADLEAEGVGEKEGVLVLYMLTDHDDDGDTELDRGGELVNEGDFVSVSDRVNWEESDRETERDENVRVGVREHVVETESVKLNVVNESVLDSENEFDSEEEDMKVFVDVREMEIDMDGEKDIDDDTVLVEDEVPDDEEELESMYERLTLRLSDEDIDTVPVSDSDV